MTRYRGEPTAVVKLSEHVTLVLKVHAQQDDGPDVSHLETDADDHERSWADFVKRPETYPAEPDLRAAMIRWPWLVRAAALHDAECDAERLRKFHDGDWFMMGIWATAALSNGYNGHRLEVRSGGLWGIESDGTADYLKETALEQLQELRADLAHLGHVVTEHQWSALVLAALEDWERNDYLTDYR